MFVHFYYSLFITTQIPCTLLLWCPSSGVLGTNRSICHWSHR